MVIRSLIITGAVEREILLACELKLIFCAQSGSVYRFINGEFLMPKAATNQRLF